MKKCWALLLIMCMGSLFASCRSQAKSWTFEGTYLYLLPTIDDSYFVIKSPASTTFPNGTRENNKCRFHSGFRAGAIFAPQDFCGRQFRGYYTHLSTEQTETVKGNFLWATLGSPDLSSSFENYAGEASAKFHFLYQRGDILFSQKIFRCKKMDFYFQGGAEFASINFHEDYRYQSTTNLGLIKQKSKTWGVGPQVGIEFDYAIYHFNFCCPGDLAFVACASGSLLAAKTHADVLNILNSSRDLDIKDKNTCRIIPAWHARFGLNYAARVCGFAGAVEVGYELNSYSRALSRVLFTDDIANSLSNNEYFNFDAQGLYVTVSLSF